MYPNYTFAVAAKTFSNDLYERIINDEEITIFSDSIELMRKAKAGVVKTGTSNLEAALCGMPFSMAYKTSMLSYLLGKRLVNLPYISIVNILLEKFVVNEFIQTDANPVSIFQDLDRILSNKNVYKSYQDEYTVIKKMLGNSGASERAAISIANYLQ